MPIHARHGNGTQYDTAPKDRSQCRDLAEQCNRKEDAVNRLETGGNACQLCLDVNKTFDKKDMGDSRTENPKDRQKKEIHWLDGKIFKKEQWQQYKCRHPVLITGNQYGRICADVFSI
jgi:hypothetical protein